MGQRGPRAIPTNVQLLRGNPAHQKFIADEPQPAAGVPEPPAQLRGLAAEEWRRIVPELVRLRLFTVFDVQPLAAYCRAYARWRAADDKLALLEELERIGSDKLTVINRAGTVVAHALIPIAERAAKDMVKYGAEFGFTPSARSRISTADSAGRVQASKFRGLLAG